MIQIPRTIEDAIGTLNCLEALLTAKEWERAAVVYAFTRDGTGEGRPKKVGSSTNLLSCNEFAALGITGLKSDTTVRAYRKAWQAAIDGGKAAPVEPGQSVNPPNLSWPPTDSRTGHPQDRIVTQIRNAEPETRTEVARELLADPEVAEHVADVIEEQVADSPAATARVNQKAEQKRPAPPRHESKRGALTAAASLTAFSAWVGEGEQVVSEVVADVMDGQADPELLTEPNRNLAVLLARLQSAATSGKDFDSALADILSGEN